jgi:hypothetical protein
MTAGQNPSALIQPMTGRHSVGLKDGGVYDDTL